MKEWKEGDWIVRVAATTRRVFKGQHYLISLVRGIPKIRDEQGAWRERCD